jgi:hypothetical protein
MTRFQGKFGRQKMKKFRNQKRKEGKEKTPREKPKNRIQGASFPAWQRNSRRNGGWPR